MAKIKKNKINKHNFVKKELHYYYYSEEKDLLNVG